MRSYVGRNRKSLEKAFDDMIATVREGRWVRNSRQTTVDGEECFCALGLVDKFGLGVKDLCVRALSETVPNEEVERLERIQKERMRAGVQLLYRPPTEEEFEADPEGYGGNIYGVRRGTDLVASFNNTRPGVREVADWFEAAKSKALRDIQEVEA